MYPCQIKLYFSFLNDFIYIFVSVYSNLNHMIIKLERVEKEKAYINFSQKANKAQYHMNTDSYLSFLPPFNQLCRSLHNTANELVSTGMYKRIISSRTLFVSEISVLRAL